MDFLDNAINADRIDLSSFNDLEPDVAVVVVVRKSTESRADARVDVGIVLQQTLHGSVVKVGTMVDAGNLTRRTTEYMRFPGI